MRHVQVAGCTPRAVEALHPGPTMKRPQVGPDTPSGKFVAPTAFPIGPKFSKYDQNPILVPDPDHEFEEAFIYNAAAIVVGDKVYLLYRAQNRAKTSSVGIAWSEDGYNFVRYHKPVVYPTEPWEQNGGCEDPRVVRDPDTKQFVMTYTAYDGATARLCVATSSDLFHWKKYPPVIQPDSAWQDIAVTSTGQEIIRYAWLKSGAVFTERHRDGKYYMVWGDSRFHLASSPDLAHWELVLNSFSSNTFAEGKFVWQNKLIEPGPAPIKLDVPGKNWWVLFYNSATTGGGDFAKDTYSISQMLIDYDDLGAGPLARMDKPFLVPDAANEIEGQVNRVVFTEGLVQFRNLWFLYFGQGDSELGVATAPL